MNRLVSSFKLLVQFEGIVVFSCHQTHSAQDYNSEIEACV